MKYISDRRCFSIVWGIVPQLRYNYKLCRSEIGSVSKQFRLVQCSNKCSDGNNFDRALHGIKLLHRFIMNRFQEKTLEILEQGVEAWNRWREANSGVIYLGNLFDYEEENQPHNLDGYNLELVNFKNTYLRGCSFRDANLRKAYLCWADLRGADFYGSDLSESRFRQARLDNKTKLGSVNLSRARLLDVDLSGLDFSDSNLSECVLSEPKGGYYPPSKAKLEGCNFERSNLSGANLEGVVLVKSKLASAILVKANLVETNQAEVDLTDANLAEADLRRASLVRADLTGANFSNANLSGANLSRCQALNANFTKANLTGACIENWLINNSTKLDDVVCEYVYQKCPDQERLPSDPNQNFAPGEFTKLFQKAFDTVNLVFQNGIDWNALLISFDKLRIEAEGAELSIQSIENKNDGAFVVRVNVPPQADKAEVEKFLKREYIAQLKILEEKYQRQLQLSVVEIEGYRRHNADIMELAKLMASRPMSGDTHIYTGGGNYIKSNTGGYVQGNYIINMSQDLSDAAREIQDVIEQLQRRGATVDVAQDQVAQDIAAQAQNNSTIKEKLLKWGQSLGDATVSDVVKGAVKLAIRSAGIPLP